MNLKKIGDKILLWTKNNILPRYVHERNILNKGISELYWVKQLGQYVFGASIALKLFINPPAQYYIYINIGIGLLFLFTSRTVGALWDRAKGYHIERQWSNKRDPFVSDMKKALKIKDDGKI